MTHRAWDMHYRAELAQRFESAVARGEKSLAPLASAYVAPSMETLAIGESKKIWAVPYFFDVADFTDRVAGLRDDEVSEALIVLHALIPVVMSAVYDFGGYVEKNTGDGVFAIFPKDSTDEDVVTRALDCSLTTRALVSELVNPFLRTRGVEEVQFRLAMNYGEVAITRMGLPSGSSDFSRNFLVAVGTPANIASKIENACPAGETWVGDTIRQYAADFQQKYFTDVTPADWEWTYKSTGAPYSMWRYDAVWSEAAMLSAHLRSEKSS
jgi:adenylate cyclase